MDMETPGVYSYVPVVATPVERVLAWWGGALSQLPKN
jgi:hypothetical protein